MNKILKGFTFTVMLFSLGISACVAKSIPTGTVRATIAVVANGESGGEGGGTEAPLVTYSDTAQGFRLLIRSPESQDITVTSGVKFNGGDDSMMLEFVNLPDTVDAMAYAKNDEILLKNLFTNYKMVGLDTSREVKNAIVLGFEASGKSSVTGKDFAARGDRYYMPTNDGRLAILTVFRPLET